MTFDLSNDLSNVTTLRETDKFPISSLYTAFISWKSMYKIYLSITFYDQ